MPPSIFLQTKFLLPQENADWLPRPHLQETLVGNLSRRLVIISAPAGFGKTTLLANYIHAQKFHIAWYQLDHLDNDPSVFLSYLVESFRQAHKYSKKHKVIPFGDATLSLLENLEENPVEHYQILTVLINELFEIVDENWLLVFEDYHQIANLAIHKLTDYLIENAPPGLQIVLSTRVDPPLQLARFRARGQLVELRGSDLRFNATEIGEWFHAKFPTLSEKSIRLLDEKTGGWAAALQIILSSLRGQSIESAEKFIEKISGTQRFIFDYLAEEVFQRLPEEEQTFLLSTSILEKMDGASCDYLLQEQNSRELLENLESSNLCLANFTDDYKWFFTHQLFREFLVGKFRREDPEEYLQMEERAAIFYEERKEWEQAFTHYLRANRPDEAARVLEVFAQKFVEHGRVETLNRYFSNLDDKTLSAHPELLLQRGNVLRRLGEARDARANYKKAQEGFEKYGNRAGICRSLTRLAEINYIQGYYPRAQELATEALQQATAEDHVERARALMSLAKSVSFLVGMNKGRSLAEQAVSEVRSAGESVAPLVRANLIQSLGQICWWHGDPQSAVRYCEEALQIMPDRLNPIAARTYITLVSPYLYWRDFEKALEYAEQGLNLAQNLHMVELLPSAYAILGNVLTRIGEPVRAESSLRQAMEMAQRLGIASYERVMAIGYLAYNLTGQGRLDEARQLVESGLWSYTGSPETYDLFVCRSVLADIALEKENFVEAEQLYKILLQGGAKNQFRIPLAMVYFGLAYIFLKSDRKEEGLEYAKESLKLIEPTHAIQLYLDQGERSYTVCSALQEKGEDSPFIRRTLESLGQSPAQREEASITVNHKAIMVQTFGSFRVLAQGKELTQEHWVSTKARDLLAYFVTFRRERISVDRVFDALWQDHAGRGKTAFHTALSRLRKALRGKDKTLKYILVEASEYWLDSARFSLDVDEFDAALLQARTAKSKKDAVAWYQKAIHLYRGEYLSGMYYDWVFPERRRLAQSYFTALETLAKLSISMQDYERAIELLERAIEIDMLAEEIYARLFEAYALKGQRAKLIRSYQLLEERLRDELGIQPMRSTQTLYQRLLEEGL